MSTVSAPVQEPTEPIIPTEPTPNTSAPQEATAAAEPAPTTSTEQPQQNEAEGAVPPPVVAESKTTAAMTTMFSAVSDYLKSEMEITKADFRLLVTMNKAASTKYGALADSAASSVKAMESLQPHYEELKPYLAKVDEVEKEVQELHKLVVELDKYSRRIEDKLKALSFKF
ncbi:biogenesis of lysosome-related organelles complex 1 subunit 2 [Pelomyxa schiedti]|nr:biogenesis of lysosome-related organelles complex 1 subunit 2 [Pelomyxa schiedti]